MSSRAESFRVTVQHPSVFQRRWKKNTSFFISVMHQQCSPGKWQRLKPNRSKFASVAVSWQPFFSTWIIRFCSFDPIPVSLQMSKTLLVFRLSWPELLISQTKRYRETRIGKKAFFKRALWWMAASTSFVNSFRAGPIKGQKQNQTLAHNKKP